MAIQIPNVGTGVPADQTGDSPWLAMQKVADNFSNQEHAASRLVGTATNQIPLAQDALKAALGREPIAYSSSSSAADLNIDNLAGGDIRSVWQPKAVGTPPQLSNNYISVLTMRIGAVSNGNSRFQFAWGQNTPGFVWRTSNYLGAWDAWEKPYTDKNTTKDSNGFIKAASPIVQVFADKAELNDDAVNQDVSYKKNGVGDYTITTQSGLSTDGWYIELPKDLNGNPKVAITLTETDGTIELKCYKRIFSMETFTFEPDLNEPLDIPDERWIDLRLNEIEREAPTMPDVDLDKKD